MKRIFMRNLIIHQITVANIQSDLIFEFSRIPNPFSGFRSPFSSEFVFVVNLKPDLTFLLFFPYPSICFIDIYKTIWNRAFEEASMWCDKINNMFMKMFIIIIMIAFLTYIKPKPFSESWLIFFSFISSFVLFIFSSIS
jgi:hypothetical protein